MSSNKDIKIQLSLDDKKLRKNLKTSLKKSEKETEHAAESMKASWGKATVAAAAVGAAIGVTVLAVKSLIKAYGEQEEAEMRMTAALKNTGQNAALVGDYYKQLASRIQGMTTIGDEEILGLMEVLIRFGNVTERNMKRAVMATINYSRATGKDLKSAGFDMAKAFAGNITMLGRFGIKVSKTALENKGLVAILDAVDAKLAGTEEAYARSVNGQMNQYSNLIGDIKEKLGQSILAFGGYEKALDGVKAKSGFVVDALKAVDSALAESLKAEAASELSAENVSTKPGSIDRLKDDMLHRKSLWSVYLDWAHKQFADYNAGIEAMSAAEEGRRQTEAAFPVNVAMKEADAIVKQITKDEEKYTIELKKQRVLLASQLKMARMVAEVSAKATSQAIDIGGPPKKDTSYAANAGLGDMVAGDIDPVIDAALRLKMTMTDVYRTIGAGLDEYTMKLGENSQRQYDALSYMTEQIKAYQAAQRAGTADSFQWAQAGVAAAMMLAGGNVKAMKMIAGVAMIYELAKAWSAYPVMPIVAAHLLSAAKYGLVAGSSAGSGGGGGGGMAMQAQASGTHTTGGTGDTTTSTLSGYAVGVAQPNRIEVVIANIATPDDIAGVMAAHPRAKDIVVNHWLSDYGSGGPTRSVTRGGQ